MGSFLATAPVPAALERTVAEAVCPPWLCDAAFQRAPRRLCRGLARTPGLPKRSARGQEHTMFLQVVEGKVA